MNSSEREQGGTAIQIIGREMGMERFLAWMSPHKDIRDLAIVPLLKGAKLYP